MTKPPSDIKAKRDDGVLQLTWPDGVIGRLPFRFLRGRCACATCVDEFTGRRKVDVSDVAADVSIREMALVGNYAMRIDWSDGHDTGIYTWDRLRTLPDECPAE